MKSNFVSTVGIHRHRTRQLGDPLGENIERYSPYCNRYSRCGRQSVLSRWSRGSQPRGGNLDVAGVQKQSFLGAGARLVAKTLIDRTGNFVPVGRNHCRLARLMLIRAHLLLFLSFIRHSFLLSSPFSPSTKLQTQARIPPCPLNTLLQV